MVIFSTFCRQPILKLGGDTFQRSLFHIKKVPNFNSKNKFFSNLKKNPLHKNVKRNFFGKIVIFSSFCRSTILKHGRGMFQRLLFHSKMVPNFNSKKNFFFKFFLSIKKPTAQKCEKIFFSKIVIFSTLRGSIGTKVGGNTFQRSLFHMKSVSSPNSPF